jgi:hypothetical protein
MSCAGGERPISGCLFRVMLMPLHLRGDLHEGRGRGGLYARIHQQRERCKFRALADQSR